MKKQKWGKDTYIIMILAGILLFIIALPTKETTDRAKLFPEGETKKQMVENAEGNKENDTEVQENEGGQQNQTSISQEEYTAYLEHKLAQALSEMAGVGKVRVMITLNTSKEQVIEKDEPNTRNITTEEDADGGKRSINEYQNEETTIYVTDTEGNQLPFVVKQLEPKIEGVMVVAQGGGNPTTSKKMIEAVQALFGIEPHKIVVAEMKKE